MILRNTVNILGVPVDHVTSIDARERIEEFIKSGDFHQIATANTDFIVKAQSDPELLSILQECDLVVADGMPVVLASGWLGCPLPERVTGADLVPDLADLAAKNGYKLFMLGAKPEIAIEARRILKRNNPGIQVVGCLSPPVASLMEMDSDTLIDAINTAKPDILLVAFGNPKQEKWIYMHRDRLHVPVCIGVGGTFDFIAGAIQRAPTWIQRLGMEWMYRLAQEPKRLWKRYAVGLFQFSFCIVTQLWAMRGGIKPTDQSTVNLMLDRINDCDGTTIAVEIDNWPKLDARSAGQLAQIAVACRRQRRTLTLLTEEPLLLRSLRSVRLSKLAMIGIRQNRTSADYEQGMFDAAWNNSSTGVELVISGRADLSAVAILENQFASSDDSMRRLVINLRSVTYVDSAFLRALKRLIDVCKAKSVDVEISAKNVIIAAAKREKCEDILGLLPSN